MSAAPSALTTATTELVTPVYRSAVTISCQLAGARGTHFGLYLVALAATIPRSHAMCSTCDALPNPLMTFACDRRPKDKNGK